MDLFKDFQPVSSKQWKQKIQMDLKGADYNDTLITETNEGIKIKPFYHQDSYQFLEIPNSYNDFKISQSVFIADEKIASKIAKNALEKGANTILFIANNVFNIDLILNNLKDFKKAKFTFRLHFINVDFIKNNSNRTNCEFEIDVIANLTKTGNWFKDKDIDIENLRTTKNHYSLGIDASVYQNSGANNVQQIAYALAHLNEYLNENLIVADCIINCNFSVGSNYFFEIAKLRAFRYLFTKLVKEYNIKPKLNLVVTPSLRNKTIYDYNINMLRTTTECMSAILGGADVITNVAYDAIYHKSNDFGERIARNQLIILQEESYFTKASEIAKGSYYIEQLTYELVEKALQLFKDIEKNNGFLVQLQKGTIQRKIEESAVKEQTQFDNKKIVLVGTNKFTNVNDKMKDDLQLYPFVKQKHRKTEIKPIIPKRLAEKVEQERLKME